MIENSEMTVDNFPDPKLRFDTHAYRISLVQSVTSQEQTISTSIAGCSWRLSSVAKRLISPQTRQIKRHTIFDYLESVKPMGRGRTWHR